MDSGLDEKWKAAVMPVALDVMDGYALTWEGRAEAYGRLKALQVPAWAISLHGTYLSDLQKEQMHLLPRFLIGCETAMVGLSLTYPQSERLDAVYKNVLFRLLQEAIGLLTAWVEGTDDASMRKNYDLFFQLHALCSSIQPPFEVAPWDELILRSSKRARFARQREIRSLVNTGARLGRGIRFEKNHAHSSLTDMFLSLLECQYRWLRTGRYYGEESYIHLFAQVFLAALEAECPPPEWLDGTQRIVPGCTHIRPVPISRIEP